MLFFFFIVETLNAEGLMLAQTDNYQGSSQLIKKIAIWLIRNDLEKIKEKALLAGIRKGDENGYARGFKEGGQIGYDEGKSVFVIEDARTVNINPDIDNSIYGPRKFHVSHDLNYNKTGM
ncbi:hypothetical protein DUQ32_22685 [Salmonella enterica subsp. enterica serovar Agona]|nr:hypothetical protein [Salmonella enterica subsp. enterica serovar Agona]